MDKQAKTSTTCEWNPKEPYKQWNRLLPAVSYPTIPIITKNRFVKEK